MKNCPLRVTCILLNSGRCRQPDIETCGDGTAPHFFPLWAFLPMFCNQATKKIYEISCFGGSEGKGYQFVSDSLVQQELHLNSD